MKLCPVNSKILRQLWSVVEQTQTSTLLGLDDADLVQQLLQQIDSTLSNEEVYTLSSYIFSRTNLIRDLAIARGV
ncbi:hypothetical protein [Fortiea contorta]|uniref:hypothetical protein n=1 Tax=Fortiea contorta TaxID=1892405 RepID=UPI000476784D|nr:hypothetical protein [Fortiea contorta]